MPTATATRQPSHEVSASDLVNPLLKVSEVMTSDPRTCSPVSTVLEATLLMRDANSGVVPVTESGRPVGVITDRDIALALPDHENDLASTPVEDIMSRDLVTIDREATIESAMDKLAGEGVRRLLVVDPGGRLVGILSWTDLVPHVSECALGWVVSRLVENR